ncbi:MAG: Bacterial alpha-L-rhamnosidase [Candidatus Lokiarchaeota archaeon]|nr:Bacterial alpha-L-rhamnosidase [Candidatus Lokiarchaeota archaeon]MBD3341977.1 Bacterial alpha-L-rhamnosidase [Candidatus Lokiarchaeota archaeon]
MITPPFELKTEYWNSPIGIDTKKPRFSWILSHPERKQSQSAYRIILSSKKNLTEERNGDLWDTGKVQSTETVNISYEGQPLKSDERYYWRVKWWDKKNRESEFSEIGYFETAILDESDWKADWITAEAFTNRKTKKKYQYRTGLTAFSGKMRLYLGVYLRKSFTIPKIPKKSKVYICGLGHYELYLNGNKIGNRVLDPGWTDTNKIALYSSYDVTEYILKENAIGVVLGNGRHVENYGYDYPKLYLQLHLEYEDGSSEIIISDDTWKFSIGPTMENGLYYGEKYDARKEMPGWNKFKFDDSEWERTVTVLGPRLFSQMLPPIKITKEINPKRLYNTDPGVYIYDFGQNFTGYLRLKVRGPRGTTIKIRYAEIVDKTGNLNTATNRTAAANDFYILKGKGLEIYKPHFTYHGFRYVEITGFPGVPTLQSVLGICFHSNVTESGEFVCSNELINRIHKNIIWGQLSNFMSIPTDCPQRDERHGWMGDAALTIEEAIYNFDVAQFYLKYLKDIQFGQKQTGELSDVVPPYWNFYPADPAWGSAYVTIAWYVYLYYNDKRVLEDHYYHIKKYVDFLHDNSENNILRKFGKYGDWCPPGNITSRKTPIEQVCSWYYFHDTMIFSKIAQILERQTDFKVYSKRAELIKSAYNKNFLKNIYVIPRLALVDDTISQTSNLLPLYLDMVPEENINKVLSVLLLSLIEQHDYHIDTGIVGTRYLMDVLSKFGKNDVAYKIIIQESYPGWGYMLKEGATTLWERWEKLEGGGMNSHNHIMLGSVDTWFYKDLAGIQLIEKNWNKIRIKPFIPSDMEYAAANLNTLKGSLYSSWKKDKESLKISISICVGVVAEVWIPITNKKTKITESGTMIYDNGNLLKDTQDILFIEKREDNVIFEMGSGYYQFKISPFSTK